MVKSKESVSKLQKINVVSAANIAALISFVLAPVYFIASLLGGYAATGVIGITFFYGLGQLIMTMIIFPISAWVNASILCLLYNLFAKRTGGIKIVLN